MSEFALMYDHAVHSGSELRVAVAYDVIKVNPLMAFLPYRPVDGLLYQTEVLTEIPTLSPVSNINEGYDASKGVTTPIDFKLATWRDKSYVDVMYKTLMKNWSLEQERAFQARIKNESLVQAYSRELFSGDQDVDAKGFDGLAKKTNALSDIVVDAGGTGSALTSIYFIKLGDEGLSGLYNANSSVTPEMMDLGVQNVTDPNTSKTFAAHQTDHTFVSGAYINVAGIGRLCNIDASNKPTLPLLNEIDANMKLSYDLIICGRFGYQTLNDLSGNNLRPFVSDTELKLRVQTYNGIPIIKTDFITQTEAQVS